MISFLSGMWFYSYAGMAVFFYFNTILKGGKYSLWKPDMHTLSKQFIQPLYNFFFFAAAIGLKSQQPRHFLRLFLNLNH